MKTRRHIWGLLLAIIFVSSCTTKEQKEEMQKDLTAKEILGNPAYTAMSYGGFRGKILEEVPTVAELKEDMLILHAMGVRIVRTYKTQKTTQAPRLLQAIQELKKEKEGFEMYVMLGIWIDCVGAFTEAPDHSMEDVAENTAEINEAVRLALQYPDIVKVLAVGNEAMVKWAAPYFVQPEVILKWVNYLQNLKKEGKLSAELWITSSDNFASWGGGESLYHVPALEDLIRAVDYLSIHTYPMHDTHYNPSFWGMLSEEDSLTKIEQIQQAMLRSRDYAIYQYQRVKAYMESLGVNKPIHIGETGWASASNGFYGLGGSKATDEYKEAVYYHLMKAWTDSENISCFYFEGFDEPWKDAANPGGSENHFGLFSVDGKAKYAMWPLVDSGVFEGLQRGGKPITKTYGGNESQLLSEIEIPPINEAIMAN